MALPQSVIDALGLQNASSVPNNISASGTGAGAGSGIASGLAAVSSLIDPNVGGTIAPAQASLAQPAFPTIALDQSQAASVATPQIAPTAAQQAPTSLSPEDAASVAQISGPVISRLPKVTLSLQQKYASGLYNALPADVLTALKNTDIARVQNGEYPLSHADTIAAAHAAQTKTPVTAEKNRSIWDVPGNALQDLEGIASSVPRLPGALIREAERLPQIGSDLAKVRSVQDVAALPGVDLIPGVHTVADLFNGAAGLRDLATHPLNTVLDVLPGAESLAELTPAAKLAEETAQANIAAGASPLENKINPISAALTKKVVTNPETGEATLANRALGNAADVIKDTRAGQAFQAAFGARARVNSQIIRAGNASADFQAHDVNGDIPSQIAARNLPLAEPTGKQLYTTYGMTRSDAANVFDLLQRDPDQIASLPPGQQTYATDIKAQQTSMAQWKVENNFLQQRGDELYRPEEANVIDRRQTQFTTSHTRVQDAYTNLIGKYVAPVGVSAQGWRDMVNQSIVSGGGVDDILNNPDIPTRPIPNPKLQALHDTYNAYLNGDATAKDLNQAVTSIRRGKTALGSTANVLASGTNPDLAASPVTSLSEFRNFDSATTKLAKAERNVQRVTVPARFQPALSDEAQRQYIAYRFRDPADIDQATALAKQGMLSQMDGFSASRTVDPATGEKIKGLLDFYDDVAPMWKEMKARGFDPTYLHSVTPEAAQSVFFPKVTEIPKTPSSLKARTLDMTPAYKDANLSLAAEAVDFIKQRASQEVVDKLATARAVPSDQVEAEFSTRAHAESLRNPQLGYDAALQKLIGQKYEPYDPETLFNTDRFTASSTPDQYITKVDAKVIRDSFAPKDYKITSALEPITGVMRTSLLPLSPRWNLYNIVGGAITGQAISSARFASYAPEAWKMVSALFHGDESAVPPELLSSLGGVKRDELEMQFRSARTIRRMVDQIRGVDPDLEAAATEGQNAGIPTTGVASTLRNAFNKVVQGSFNINQRFDDMYRTMGYLDGYDTSGAIDGMTREGRIQYGLQQANRVLQDMNQLTPFELNVMRPIFPFYTYYQHILRYALRYPIDHPLRVAVTSAIAQQEEKRLGGLPLSFLNVFTWGKPDAQGNQSGVNTTSLNPFTDVSNLMTVAGWLGATNPVVKSIADAAGIDTDNGGPELYPTLGYDPTTGKLTNSTPNPLESLIFNTIPQTQIIGNLVGQNAEYQALLRNNPQAAASLLRTEGGLPLVLRSYNLPQSRIKAELNRQQAAEAAKTADLKSGNFGDLAQFPSLTPTLSKLAALQQSGQLARYQPAPVPTPSTGSVAEQALAGTIGFQTLPAEQQGAYASQLAALQSPQNPSTP